MGKISYARLGKAAVLLAAILLAQFMTAWRIANKEFGMGYFVVVAAMLLALLIVACSYYFWRKKPDKLEVDPQPMSLALRRIVVAYLLLLGALIVGLLIDLNMMDFPETAVTIEITPPPPPPTPTPSPTQVQSATPRPSSTPAPSPSPSPSSQSGSGTANTGGNTNNSPAAGAGSGTQNAAASTDPVVLQVIPRTSSGTIPTVYLAIYGKNLKDKSTVRFNGQERPTSHIGTDDDLLEAQPQAADIAGQGTITVDVVTKGTPDKISNSVIVPVLRPVARLDLGLWQPLVSREVQLLLIVLVAGAFGCLIHALRSITVFIGNRTAIASWFWWYITRPLVGMSLALIFYAVLRGGFLAGTSADAKVVSPFGVLAIGALVGMFSDSASEKLAEIFATLFQPKGDDQRKDKLSAPVVSQLQPSQLKVGTAPLPLLTIKGDHLEKIVKVKFDQQERTANASAQQVTVPLQASDVTAAHEFTITLVDSDNKTYPAGTLKVEA